jgi:hypothetical protein
MALVKYIGSSPGVYVPAAGKSCLKGNSIEVSSEIAVSLLEEPGTWEAGNKETEELVPSPASKVQPIIGYQGPYSASTLYSAFVVVTEGSGNYLSLVQTEGEKPSSHPLAWLPLGVPGTVTTKQIEEALPSSVESSSAMAASQIVYVAKYGNDGNSGLLPGQAVLTGKKAVELLEATAAKTGTIIFGYGTWQETVKRLNGGNIFGQGGKNKATVIEAIEGAASNCIEDQFWGNPAAIGTGGVIDHIAVFGNFAAHSSYAKSTIVTSSVVVTAAGVTLEVLSTEGEYPNNLIWVGGEHLCKFTGIAGNTFTGVKPLKAQFTATVEMVVKPGAGVGNGIALQSKQCIVGEDVLVEKCVGSSIVPQGAGETGEQAFEVLIHTKRLENNKRYCLEINPYANDGKCWGFIGSSFMGAASVGSAEWTWIDCHPVGGNTNQNVLQPFMWTIYKRLQHFINCDLDSFVYDAIRIDTLGMNENIDSVTFEGYSQHASIGCSNAGSVVSYYGNGTTSTATGHMFKGTFPGRIDHFATPCPMGYLVSEQNLKTISEAAGNVQVLNALGISPKSALGGPLKLSTGDELAYTGVTAMGGSVKKEGKTGEETLEVTIVPESVGWAASGWITVAVPGVGSAPARALRLKYGKVKNSGTAYVFEEIAGKLPENIPSGLGVLQHFITGVTGGTTTNAADNTSWSQLGRSVPTITGEADVLLGPGPAGGEGGPNHTTSPEGLGLRFTSEANYRVIFQGRALLAAQAAVTSSLNEGGLAGLTGNSGGLNVFYVNPADYPAGSTLRVVLTAATNALAPVSNFTAGLYPVSGVAGTENQVTAAVGSQVANSEAKVEAPAKETLTEAASGAIAMPASAGYYVLQLIVSANNVAKSAVAIRARLEAKV